MSASKFVGRVGGLAVVLGVGAGVYTGAATAWADSPSTGSDSQSARPSAGPSRDSGSSTARHSSATASGTVTRNASRSAGRSDIEVPFASAAVKPRSESALAVAVPAPEATPVAEAAPVAEVPAPESPSLSSIVTAPTAPLAVAAKPAAAALPAAAVPAAAAALTLPLILGPSGVPVPSTDYLNTVMNYYLRPDSTPPYASPQPELVFTPEGLYPITGVKSLPLNTSVDQGLAILSDVLAKVVPGTPTTVFGYSQSAIIGSLLQAGYVPSPPVNSDPPPTIPVGLRDSINFFFVGNEMNPNGGFLSRFPGLNLPSLGIPFYGATPENAYPTTNYAREYDGFADFPRYPINFLSDLNAGLGIVFVHTQYTPAPDCKGNYCLTQQQVKDAIALPSTSPTQKYYFMPTANLPLLEPLRFIPFVGNPIADLLQPALKVVVNLGYGDPAHGFPTTTQPDANVLVPFGLFPRVGAAEVASQLAAGVKQGIHDFLADFGPHGSLAKELATLPSLSLVSSGGFIPTVQHLITAVTERISASAASLYAALLPTADIINAIVTILPGYDINLALSGIQQALHGDVIAGLTNAIGLPIAADVGLVTTAGLVGVLAWAQAIAGAVSPAASITA